MANLNDIESQANTIKKVGESLGNISGVKKFNSNLESSAENIKLLNNEASTTKKVLGEISGETDEVTQSMRVLNRHMGEFNTYTDDIEDFMRAFGKGNTQMIASFFSKIAKGGGKLEGFSNQMSAVSGGFKLLGRGFGTYFKVISMSLGIVKNVIVGLGLLFNKSQQLNKTYSTMLLNVGGLAEALELLADKGLIADIDAQLTKVATNFGKTNEEIREGVEAYLQAGGKIDFSSDKIIESISEVGESFAKWSNITGFSTSNIAQHMSKIESMAGFSGLKKSSFVMEQLTEDFQGTGLAAETFFSTILESAEGLSDLGGNIGRTSRMLSNLTRMSGNAGRGLKFFQNLRGMGGRDIGANLLMFQQALNDRRSRGDLRELSESLNKVSDINLDKFAKQQDIDLTGYTEVRKRALKDAVEAVNFGGRRLVGNMIQTALDKGLRALGPASQQILFSQLEKFKETDIKLFARLISDFSKGNKEMARAFSLQFGVSEENTDLLNVLEKYTEEVAKGNKERAEELLKTLSGDRISKSILKSSESTKDVARKIGEKTIDISTLLSNFFSYATSTLISKFPGLIEGFGTFVKFSLKALYKIVDWTASVIPHIKRIVGGTIAEFGSSIKGVPLFNNFGKLLEAYGTELESKAISAITDDKLEEMRKKHREQTKEASGNLINLSKINEDTKEIGKALSSSKGDLGTTTQQLKKLNKNLEKKNKQDKKKNKQDKVMNRKAVKRVPVKNETLGSIHLPPMALWNVTGS